VHFAPARFKKNIAVFANATVVFKAGKPSTYNLLVTDIKGKIFIGRKGAVVSGNNIITIPVDKFTTPVTIL